ncbi:MAG: nicotinate-nucleotide adenylyltransferase [Sideroxydans sp.]
MGIAPIGILGGTFDPIHNGHLRLAQEALEQCRMQQVRFIPSGTPPHRARPIASAEARLDMVRTALHSHHEFSVDVREVYRTDPCYSVDTLTSLRAEFGDEQPLCLLLGSDAFLNLHTWHEWQRVFELTHIVVIQRPGRPLGNAMETANEELKEAYRARLAPAPRRLHESASGAIVALDMPLLDISATDIRRRCAENKNIRYLTTDAVTHYIYSKQIYTPC